MTQLRAGEWAALSSGAPASVSALIGSLFEREVGAAELRQPGNPSWLLAAERLALTAPSAKRLREFAAGRVCARHALAQIGVSAGPLLPDDERYPRWPVATVGSITHTSGFAGAVVAHRSRYVAIGIDAEVVEDVEPEVRDYICTADELAWLAQLPDALRPGAMALIFSAKEAFYKCQFALSRQWLEFHDVAIEVGDSDLFAGRFAVRPLMAIGSIAPTCRYWCGRFRFVGAWVMAGIAVPAQ